MWFYHFGDLIFCFNEIVDFKTKSLNLPQRHGAHRDEFFRLPGETANENHQPLGQVKYHF
jgi:hypothetical protein